MYTWFTIGTPFSHIRLPQDPNKSMSPIPAVPQASDPSFTMVAAKCYIALLLACLVQVSLAFPVRSVFCFFAYPSHN